MIVSGRTIYIPSVFGNMHNTYVQIRLAHRQRRGRVDALLALGSGFCREHILSYRAPFLRSTHLRPSVFGTAGLDFGIHFPLWLSRRSGPDLVCLVFRNIEYF